MSCQQTIVPIKGAESDNRISSKNILYHSIKNVINQLSFHEFHNNLQYFALYVHGLPSRFVAIQIRL